MQAERTYHIKLEPASGRRIHTVELLRMEKIDLGTELKLRITASFLGKKCSFVAREVPTEYLETWKMLKNGGFPVIPLLRITKELPNFKRKSAHSIIAVVPDISSNGSKLYGRSLSWEVTKKKYKPSLKNDQLFLDIVSQQRAELTEAVEKIVDLANKLDIVLPEDGDIAELVIHPDGSWELLMVDIELARKRIKRLETRALISRVNKNFGQDFLRSLENIRQNI